MAAAISFRRQDQDELREKFLVKSEENPLPSNLDSAESTGC